MKPKIRIRPLVLDLITKKGKDAQRAIEQKQQNPFSVLDKLLKLG